MTTSDEPMTEPSAGLDAATSYRGHDIVAAFRKRMGLGIEFEEAMWEEFKDRIVEQIVWVSPGSGGDVPKRINLAEALRRPRAGLHRQHFEMFTDMKNGKESRPDLNATLVSALLMGKGLTDLCLPDHSDLVNRAVRKLLVSVRKRIDPDGGDVSIWPYEVAILRYVVTHPRFAEITSETNAAILDEIGASYVPKRFISAAPACDALYLRGLLATWFIPWVVLMDALPLDWILKP